MDKIIMASNYFRSSLPKIVKISDNNRIMAQGIVEEIGPDKDDITSHISIWLKDKNLDVWHPQTKMEFKYSARVELLSMDIDAEGKNIVCLTKNLDADNDIRITLFYRDTIAKKWCCQPVAVGEYMKLGSHIAISGDSRIIVVSTPYYGSTAESDLILVNILSRASGSWRHVASLKAPNKFNTKVSVSSLSVNFNGRVITVGTCGKKNESMYSYAYRRSRLSNKWSSQLLLTEGSETVYNSNTVLSDDNGSVYLIAPKCGDVYVAEQEEGELKLTKLAFTRYSVSSGVSADGSKIMVTNLAGSDSDNLFIDIYHRDKDWEVETFTVDKQTVVTMLDDGRIVAIHQPKPLEQKAA